MAGKFFSKLRGTIETIFSIGVNGPNLKNNSNALEARNPADTDFSIFRAAPPVGLTDVATKAYVDQLQFKPAVSGQFDGNNALPTNTGNEQFFVVTTTGPNATLGQLLFDNGSGSGTVTVMGAVDGRAIITPIAYTGGTQTFRADSLYAWDAPTSTWLNLSGSALSGAIREIRMALTNAASQASNAQIPAGAVVNEILLNVTTAYSAGGTVAVGQTGSTALLAATTDTLPTVVGMYQVMQDTVWGAAALSVLATIAGAPAAGAATLIVKYTVPDA